MELLISTTNLEKEKEETMKQMLRQEVHSYLKYNDHSGDEFRQALTTFTVHLIKVYNVHLVTLAVGSVIIILYCPTLESLDLLWRDCISGHLDKVAERCLVTDKMKKSLKLETVCLKTTITKESYFNCRKALMELSSTSSGEFNKAFGKYSYIVPEESSFAFQFQEYTIYKHFSKITIRIIVIVIITTARIIIILLSQIFVTPKALYII